MHEFLAAMVTDAGNVATSVRESGITVSTKGALDFVTEADTATEDFIRLAIHDAFPNDSIIGEESEATQGTSDRVWVVDPIDGTHNFMVGIPFWGISIGVIEAGRAVAGAIHCPPLQETLIATERNGVFLNGDQLGARESRDRCRSPLVLFGMPKPPNSAHDNDVIRFAQDQLGGTYRRLASTAVSLLHVVKGSSDIYVGFGEYPWDVCAGAIAAQMCGLRHSFDFNKLFNGQFRFLCATEEYFDTAEKWLFSAGR